MGRPFVHFGPRALSYKTAKRLPGRRICLGKPCFFPGCLFPWCLRRDKKEDSSRIKSQETRRRAPNALHSLLPHFSFCFSDQRRTGLSVFVPAGGSRGLPGSHGLGMCSLLHFYHNNSLINSPAAAGGSGRDMCKRGGGARGPAGAKGRRSLSTASPLPTLLLPRHRKFLVLPCCCKTCFWEVTFNKDGVNGLFKKR